LFRGSFKQKKTKKIMKTLISNEELIALRKSAATLRALEQGGVDNWQWYGDSMENYIEPEEVKGAENVIDLKSGESCFYQNNPAEFVSHLDSELSMIKLYAGFDVDIDRSNFCTQCMVGGSQSGYMGAHTCEEAGEVIDHVFEIMDESRGHVVVPVKTSDLNMQPIVMLNHSALYLELIKVRSEYKKKTIKIKSKIIDLESEAERIEKQILLRTDILEEL
jgi:hypothetical protein